MDVNLPQIQVSETVFYESGQTSVKSKPVACHGDRFKPIGPEIIKSSCNKSIMI